MTTANVLLYNCSYQLFSRDIGDEKRNISSKLYPLLLTDSEHMVDLSFGTKASE